ncbi:MAG: AAA family ATPase [Oligoflexia bacterium]|nr:AAA family ATPase [Oligoflexia bacterium]
MQFIKRIILINRELKRKSILLLGPRRTGKSALLRHQLKADRSFDLLRSETFQTLAFRPSLLREQLKDSDRVIVIDEIQKLPILMDEVHALIEERDIRFVLTGSSARKLRRTHTSLMAGRARRLYLHPFCHAELSTRFSLLRALRFGTLPPVYLQGTDEDAWRELRDYSGDYLREEILAEALVRKIDAFSRFLPSAARMNGELLNFEAAASDSQVPARTIREYYAVLEDTLVGRSLEPYRFKGSKSRKAIATSKFYFFDCGVLNALLGRRSVSEDSPEFGNLFETWVMNELSTFLHYRGEDLSELKFWRSPTGDEVDFLFRGEVAIEVKATRHVTERHLRGLLALDSLCRLRRKIVICREAVPRKLGAVEVMPWEEFVRALWAGDLL